MGGQGRMANHITTRAPDRPASRNCLFQTDHGPAIPMASDHSDVCIRRCLDDPRNLRIKLCKTLLELWGPLRHFRTSQARRLRLREPGCWQNHNNPKLHPRVAPDPPHPRHVTDHLRQAYLPWTGPSFASCQLSPQANSTRSIGTPDPDHARPMTSIWPGSTNRRRLSQSGTPGGTIRDFTRIS